MTKNQKLHDELSRLLQTHELTWMSESDEPVLPVRLPWHEVKQWQQEANGAAERRLSNQVEQSATGGWVEIVRAMKDAGRIVSIKQATDEPAEFELYILCYFGYHYVGIKTKLIET